MPITTSAAMLAAIATLKTTIAGLDATEAAALAEYNEQLTLLQLEEAEQADVDDALESLEAIRTNRVELQAELAAKETSVALLIEREELASRDAADAAAAAIYEGYEEKEAELKAAIETVLTINAELVEMNRAMLATTNYLAARRGLQDWEFYVSLYNRRGHPLRFQTLGPKTVHALRNRKNWDHETIDHTGGY